MDNLEYKRFYEELIEILKCVLCLGFLKPPVIECDRGHGICYSCKKQLLQCPTCRSKFRMYRATTLSQIMEVLPIACSNTGCTVIMCGDDDHLQFCGFRRTICMFCFESLTVNTLMEHYKNQHPQKEIYVEGTSAGNWQWNSLTFTNSVSLFYYYDNFFWRKMSVNSDKSVFKVTFTYVPKKKTFGRYYADIIFEKKPLQTSSCTEIALLDDEINIDSVQPNLIMPVRNVTEYTENGFITFAKMTIKNDITFICM